MLCKVKVGSLNCDFLQFGLQFNFVLMPSLTRRNIFKDILYHVEPGNMIGDKNLSSNTIYVSKGGRKKWNPLHKFVFVSMFRCQSSESPFHPGELAQT